MERNMSKQRDDFKNSFQNIIPSKPLKLNKQMHMRPPQVEVPRNEPTQNEVTQVEHAQKEIAQNEVPHFEAPSIGGFFKLPHDAFFDEALRRLSGDEFRLFIWMSSQGWRFRDSDGSLRASVSFIEVGTGMSHASVSRALKRLREANLIELIAADYKKGNVWRVCDKLRAIDPPTRSKLPHIEQPQDEVARSEAPQHESGVTSKRGSTHLNLRQHLPQNVGTEAEGARFC
jgi:DNA-binding transcriptional ArsR family regulator